MEEFRFVVEDIDALNPNKSNAANFTDYYLSRTERIRRFFKPEDKWLRTKSEPAAIVKNHMPISEEEGEEAIKQAILIITKKGVGHLKVDNLEGYAERVIITKDNKEILDEVQIEFETGMDKLPILKEKLKPIKIITTGLFDHAQELISQP